MRSLSSDVGAQPFLKWAGGKRWLLPTLLPLIGRPSGRYFEPFLGAGATFLALEPSISRIGTDTNNGLIEAWHSVRDSVVELIEVLGQFENTPECFYSVRNWDRDEARFAQLRSVERAARLIYLNKTCFNGLHRVNKRGQFNVPFGRYSNPNFLNVEILREANRRLNSLGPSGGEKAKIEVANFLEVTRDVQEGDVVYFDPPYEPLSKTSSFVAYQEHGFSRTNQTELRDLAVELRARGAKVIVSNSTADFILGLYDNLEGFECRRISSNRSISATSSGRKPVTELLVVGRP